MTFWAPASAANRDRMPVPQPTSSTHLPEMAALLACIALRYASVLTCTAAAMPLQHNRP